MICKKKNPMAKIIKKNQSLTEVIEKASIRSIRKIIQIKRYIQ